jgi:hypothetical protein
MRMLRECDSLNAILFSVMCFDFPRQVLRFTTVFVAEMAHLRAGLMKLRVSQARNLDLPLYLVNAKVDCYRPVLIIESLSRSEGPTTGTQ